MNEVEKLNAIIDSYQPRLQALKDENFELKESLKCFQKPEVVKALTDYRTGEIDNLRQENERLKEEVETRDNLIDHFRDEALYRAIIASEYQKDKTKLEQTLQEIKEIAENTIKLVDYKTYFKRDNKSFKQESFKSIKQILDLITKAEEE